MSHSFGQKWDKKEAKNNIISLFPSITPFRVEIGISDPPRIWNFRIFLTTCLQYFRHILHACLVLSLQKPAVECDFLLLLFHYFITTIRAYSSGQAHLKLDSWSENFKLNILDQFWVATTHDHSNMRNFAKPNLWPWILHR